MTTPPIFPVLHPGWSVVRRAQPGATLVATAGTRMQYRAQLWTVPVWEWDLVYEYLPNKPANGVTASDFLTQLGMFLQESGMFSGFLYKDQDENTVVGQLLAVTDGTTQTFQLRKTFGLETVIDSILLGGYSTEPIGYTDLSQSFVLRLNGTPISVLDYSIDTSTPCNQRVTLSSAPPEGQRLTVDMSFYYWVHFKDDVQEYDNFADLLWEQKKLTLQSLKDA